MTPYYQDDAVTIWHGDCRKILNGGELTMASETQAEADERWFRSIDEDDEPMSAPGRIYTSRHPVYGKRGEFWVESEPASSDIEYVRADVAGEEWARKLEGHMRELEGEHLTSLPDLGGEERQWAARIIGLGLAIDWIRDQVRGTR